MGFIGIIIVFVGVFGGFLLAGGHMSIFLKAAPLEMMIIAGAAFGGYIIANPMKVIKAGFRLGLRAMTAKGPQKKRLFRLAANDVSAFPNVPTTYFLPSDC